MFLFYAEKSSDYAEDVDVSELCGSVPPQAVRCPDLNTTACYHLSIEPSYHVNSCSSNHNWKKYVLSDLLAFSFEYSCICSLANKIKQLTDISQKSKLDFHVQY